MEHFSYVGWLLGALFSIAVLGMLSESVLGGSQARKVVISLETSFKILVFENIRAGFHFSSILAPPLGTHGCSLADIFDVAFWGEF